MDKLVAFFKNVWFRRTVALLGYGYTIFIAWIAYLCFGYFIEAENATPLFVLYLFANIVGLSLLIISRKQVLTQVNSYILPLLVFAIVICGFGNWYIVVPPAAVMAVVFFANSSNETLKTVLGTLYLLMFVIGIVGYIGISTFMGNISFTGVELSHRDRDYEKLSSDGKYRIVRYFDESGDRTLQKYYVEATEDDIGIPLGTAKKVFGCKFIYTSAYEGTPKDLVDWSFRTLDGEKTEVLLVENIVRENPYLIKEIDANDTTSKSSSSVSPVNSSIENLIKPNSGTNEPDKSDASVSMPTG